MHALLSATTGLIGDPSHLELSLVMIAARLAVSYALNHLLAPALLPEKSRMLPTHIATSLLALMTRRSAR